ncbi:MAG: Ig-like domain repeat protein, partial [Dehalococcoidia bacterium]|nr:Ig-like domain repeat protein [Dehalococcoidia bacterium]
SAPGSVTVTAATTTGISIAWSAASDDVAVTGYRAFLDGMAKGTSAQLTYPFSGLVCGRTYTLGVEAYDAAGNTSARTSIQAATAACPDTQPPTAPTGLNKSFVAETSFTLSWNASSDDSAVAGYGVYAAGLKVAQTGSTSYAFTGLSCGTQYTVGVDAYDPAGNRSAVSSFVASTAPCPDTTAPSAPTGLTTGSVGQTSIGLSWAASTDNVGVTGYDVIRNGSTIATVTGTGTTFTGLSCGTSYTLGVKAFDAAGNRSALASTSVSTSACSDSTPPSTPTGLATSNVAQTSLTLSWAASTDNVGVTGYRLYQGGRQVGTATGTSYGFSGLACGTGYTLGVAAVDAAGNVSSVASLVGQTTACSGGDPVTPSLFVAQSAAGSGDGSSCANAKAASFFNTVSNWGAGRPIAAGVVVGLCGTITSTLTAQGSGSPGSPVTIYFTSGAKLSQPVCGSCLTLSGRSHIVVDGGTNGIVESSANGTRLANHSGAYAIQAISCSNCEIKNLTIGPIYTIAPGDSYICSSGCAVDNAGVRCINFSGDNWKIHDNVMHDASWCLVENGDNASTRIYNNNIYNFDHGWTTGGGTRGNLYFYGNHLHDTAIWDNCNSGGNNCHHDGIHCFDIPGPSHYVGVYVYNNIFDGAVGSAMTSWIYMESNAGSACADSTSKWYIFNNLFSSSDQVPTNPYVGSTTGSVVTPYWLYNNTFAGPGAGKWGGNNASCAYASRDWINNAAGGCYAFFQPGSGTTDYNAYANGSGSDCFPSGGCNFTAWQSSGKDTHSVYNASSAVGSNVAGVGANLTSLCTGDLVPLCSDINGNPRPSSGPWKAGAFG